MYQFLLWQVLPSSAGETFLLWQVLPSPAGETFLLWQTQTDSSPVRKVVLRFFWRFGHFSDGISSIQYSKFHINFVKETVFHGKGICKNLISKYFSSSSQGIFQNMPGD
jgi:hypothetical protein